MSNVVYGMSMDFFKIAIDALIISITGIKGLSTKTFLFRTSQVMN